MRRKRIGLIILLVFVAIVLVTCFGLLLENNEKLSTKYKESQREKVIVHEGKKYRYNEHLSNYLFLGIDTRDAVSWNGTPGQSGQADAIFLVSYDRVKKTVQCISIPRDTIAKIHLFAPDGTDLGYSDAHINIQYAYGDGKTKSCQLMKEAVQTLLHNVPIQGYCAINMDGIPIAVDMVGGVKLTVPDNSLEDVSEEFKEGTLVTITKENAELFLRYRDVSTSHSASGRMVRQTVFMQAFLNKAKEVREEEKDFVLDLREQLKLYMVSNIGNDVFVKFLQATSDSEKKIVDIPGKKVDGMNFDEYHINEEELYKLILQVFYKEELS